MGLLPRKSPTLAFRLHDFCPPSALHLCPKSGTFGTQQLVGRRSGGCFFTKNRQKRAFRFPERQKTLAGFLICQPPEGTLVMMAIRGHGIIVPNGRQLLQNRVHPPAIGYRPYSQTPQLPQEQYRISHAGRVPSPLRGLVSCPSMPRLQAMSSPEPRQRWCSAS